MRIVVRTTRAFTLRQEVEIQNHAALRLLRALDGAEGDAAGGALLGWLRVNATIPLDTSFVVRAVWLFAARDSGPVVDLSLADDIVDHAADRAIRMGDLPDSGLVARRLTHSRRAVCTSPTDLAMRGTSMAPAKSDSHDGLDVPLPARPPSRPR